MRLVAAEEDPSAVARVVRRIALHYVGGADPALDRPAHVRAASGLCWIGPALAVVSDDASFIGLVDPDTGLTQPITLPHAPGQHRQFDKGRDNKADKLDLESIIAVGGRLIAFGSDSGLAVRRQVVVLDNEKAAPRIVPLPRLYEALRQPDVIGRGCLNIEGATVFEDTIVLGNRGGDVGDDGEPTCDAVVRLPVSALLSLIEDPEHAPLPPLVWQPLRLSHLGGSALRLTELEAVNGSLMFAATAEATTSAYDDGHVTGSVIGSIGGAMSGYDVDYVRILDEHGAPLVAKIEGLAWDARTRHWLATIDADDPARPSELLEIALED
jgi:hypothetical protein